MSVAAVTVSLLLLSQTLDVDVRWVRDSRVGSAPTELEWRVVDERREARFSCRGEPDGVAVVAAGAVPREIWRLGHREPVDVPWRTLIPERLHMAELQLPGEPTLAVRLKSVEGELSVSVAQEEVLRADFEVGGVSQIAWFVDADLDGALAGEHDRWVAGPGERMDGLRFPNPDVEMRPLSEPWCLGPAGLSFAGQRGRTVRIDVGPRLDRSALRERHERRLVDAFVASLDVSREAILEKRGDDPSRPVAAARASWTHVDRWDEALALGRSSSRPLLVIYTTSSCTWCRFLSFVTLADAEVDALLRRCTRVKIDPGLAVDDRLDELGISGVPATVMVDAEGGVRVAGGFKPPSEYAASLRAWLDDQPTLDDGG